MAVAVRDTLFLGWTTTDRWRGRATYWCAVERSLRAIQLEGFGGGLVCWSNGGGFYWVRRDDGAGGMAAGGELFDRLRGVYVGRSTGSMRAVGRTLRRRCSPRRSWTGNSLCCPVGEERRGGGRCGVRKIVAREAIQFVG